MLERKCLDPLCSAVGEIPEELYQAQFLPPLRHIASPGMYRWLHTITAQCKVRVEHRGTPTPCGPLIVS